MRHTLAILLVAAAVLEVASAGQPCPFQNSGDIWGMKNDLLYSPDGTESTIYCNTKVGGIKVTCKDGVWIDAQCPNYIHYDGCGGLNIIAGRGNFAVTRNTAQRFCNDQPKWVGSYTDGRYKNQRYRLMTHHDAQAITANKCWFREELGVDVWSGEPCASGKKCPGFSVISGRDATRRDITKPVRVTPKDLAADATDVTYVCVAINRPLQKPVCLYRNSTYTRADNGCSSGLAQFTHFEDLACKPYSFQFCIKNQVTLQPPYGANKVFLAPVPAPLTGYGLLATQSFDNALELCNEHLPGFKHLAYTRSEMQTIYGQMKLITWMRNEHVLFWVRGADTTTGRYLYNPAQDSVTRAGPHDKAYTVCVGNV